MNVTMFGAGYVGLVTGACFAEMGNTVVCVDVDEAKVEGLLRGVLPIYEPGLESMVHANAAAQRLVFTTDGAVGVAHGEIIFIAVGTPADDDGSADLRYVLAAAETIGTHMLDAKVVVDKSTVPVGTADKVRDKISETLRARGSDIPFDVVSNPEFLKEGAAVADFMKPDRVVIGTANADSARLLEQLYAPFNRNHDKIVHMDVRSAELTKYAANVMLATRISLMNELANMADRLGADIEAVRRGIGSDPRIGYDFIYPGLGYGGSCFPKDVKALVNIAAQVQYDAEIVRSVEAVNERQKAVLFDKMSAYFSGDLQGRTVAIWGLAFKPNTDDMREAASRTLMQLLWDAGAVVRAYDPVAGKEARRLYGEREDLVICDAREDALTDADALVVITEWNEFRSPDFQAIKAALKTPAIFDGRNLYDPKQMKALGFDHFAIGRAAVE
ncbi:MAG: UDP-glucose/GDP-mannose dehydrogenase family protein [Gammaproteobacteria bacterium]|nr:UDP-glucose/GDP-mannose dehydrogenase family protein [Gammaproteobacteria bacterium]